MSFTAPPPPPLFITKRDSDFSVKAYVAEHLKIVQSSENNTRLTGEKTLLKLCTDLLGALNLDSGSVQTRDGDVKLYSPCKDVKLYSSCKEIVIMPEVQVGPMCGLVALSMASQVICKHPVSPDNLYKFAASSGYTKRGEMFSAFTMLEVAKRELNCSGIVIDSSSSASRRLLLEHLLHNHILLVPYDRDHNNAPCKKQGCAAHWAVISGFVICCRDLHQNRMNELDLPKLAECGKVWYMNCLEMKRSDRSLISEDIIDCHQCAIYVFAHQGKSLRTHLWNLDVLLESNQQLRYLDKEIVDNKEDYILNDMEENLSGKIVVLYPEELNISLSDYDSL